MLRGSGVGFHDAWRGASVHVHRARSSCRSCLTIAVVIAGSACRAEHLIASAISGGDQDVTGSSDVTLASNDASATSESAGTSSPTGTDGSTSTGGPLGPDLPLLEETGPLPPCEIPSGQSECDTTGDPFNAIGLGCSASSQDAIPIEDAALVSADDGAWRIAAMYGNEHFTATANTRLLVMTTGVLPQPDGAGRLTLPVGPTRAANGNNGNPDAQSLPAGVQATSGSAGGAGGQPFVHCDGVGDCSETLPRHFEAANDLVSFHFDVEVPAGTFGYEVDLAWFSAEFPERAGDPANDLLVWWQSSEKYTGNLATISTTSGVPEPMSATGLAEYIVSQTDVTGTGALVTGTGFSGSTTSPCSPLGLGTYPQCPLGATTGWLTLRGPVNPTETVTTIVALFDQGDRNLDTTVLIDNWRWDCAGCERVGECGLSKRAEPTDETTGD